MQKNPAVNLTVLSAPASTADNKQKLSCQHPNGNVFNLHLGQGSAKVPTGFQGQYDFEIWEFEIPDSGGKKIWCGNLIPGASQNQPIAPQPTIYEKAAEAARQAAPVAPQSPSQPAQRPNDTQEQILRQCAGKCASWLVAGNIVTFEERFQEAERWVGYFKNGLTPNLLPAEKRFGDNAQANSSGALQLDIKNPINGVTNPQNIRDMDAGDVP